MAAAQSLLYHSIYTFRSMHRLYIYQIIARAHVFCYSNQKDGRERGYILITFCSSSCPHVLIDTWTGNHLGFQSSSYFHRLKVLLWFLLMLP